MEENLTWKRNNIFNINKETNEMREVIINKIKWKLSYLVGTVHKKRELDNLSPDESIDKIIEDLLSLKKEDDFRNINNEYINLREKKTNIEEEISGIKQEIAEALNKTNKNIVSLPIGSIFEIGLARLINNHLSWPNKKGRENTLWDLAKYCIENDNWEYHLMKFHGINATDIQNIKDIFDKYNINI